MSSETNKQLIKRLRAAASVDCTEAADAIEKLTAEKAALLADLKKSDTDCDFCRHIKGIGFPCDCECETCRLDCACKTCRDSSNWEWRGLKEASV